MYPKISLETVKIEQAWKNALSQEFLSPYFAQIKHQLLVDKKTETIYPPPKSIFKAFDITPFDKVKVVILGQDPYHGENQAMGLAFSVPSNTRIPPSLINIYKELSLEYENYKFPDNGDLTPWAEQGVLLLNSSLTVLAGKPASHAKIGWQKFTDAAISQLSNLRENLVFMLWGNFAKSKKHLIDNNKHLVLESAHPSPLAQKGFIGNNHFRFCNDYLSSHNIAEINWQIPSKKKHIPKQSSKFSSSNLTTLESF